MSDATPPLVGIVLAHEAVANALVTAVAAIAGEGHGLIAVSNAGCDRAAIEQRLADAIASRAAVIFADLPGGSCAFGAASYARSHPEVAVVTGVNLAMLLDFAFHRGLSPEAARERAVETGRGAIAAPGAPGGRSAGGVG